MKILQRNVRQGGGEGLGIGAPPRWNTPSHPPAVTQSLKTTAIGYAPRSSAARFRHNSIAGLSLLRQASLRKCPAFPSPKMGCSLKAQPGGSSPPSLQRTALCCRWNCPLSLDVATPKPARCRRPSRRPNANTRSPSRRRDSSLLARSLGEIIPTPCADCAGCRWRDRQHRRKCVRHAAAAVSHDNVVADWSAPQSGCKQRLLRPKYSRRSCAIGS